MTQEETRIYWRIEDDQSKKVIVTQTGDGVILSLPVDDAETGLVLHFMQEHIKLELSKFLGP